jgi:hypothetical protein
VARPSPTFRRRQGVTIRRPRVLRPLSHPSRPRWMRRAGRLPTTSGQQSGSSTAGWPVPKPSRWPMRTT